MAELRDNVDVNWVGRTLIALTNDLRDVKSDMRHVRDNLGVVTMRVIRIDNALSALRDDLRALGSRITALEAPPG